MNGAPSGIWFLLTLAGIYQAAPGPYLQKQGPALLKISAKVQGEEIEIRLSDTLRLTVEVEGKTGLEVKPPAKTDPAQPWNASPGKPIVEPVDPARVRWRQDITLEPLAPGKHLFQPGSLQFREKGSAWQTITWQPVAFFVKTSISQPDPKDMRDITDIEGIPTHSREVNWWYWLGGGGILVVLAGGAWLFFRRRGQRQLYLKPDEWANRELDRILALNLPASNRVERFFTLLSNVLRRYLENRFHIPARRQTTPEFFQALENFPSFSEPQKTLLHDFLQRCDLAKFAGVQPTAEECRAALDLVRDFVKQTGAENGPERKR